MFLQQPEPTVTWIVPKPRPAPGAGDTLHNLFSLMMSSLGLVGVLVLAAVVTGGVLAWWLVRRHRQRPPEADHLPSVAPMVAMGRDRRT